MQIQSALKEIEICSKLIFIVARKKYRSEYISADDMMSVRENLKQMTELFKNLPPEQISEATNLIEESKADMEYIFGRSKRISSRLHCFALGYKIN